MTKRGAEEGGADRPTGPFSDRSELEFRRLLEKLPAGAYTCDPGGLITFYNQPAVRLWGRAPALNDPADRFCGSFKLFTSDGAPMAHDQCWMARALREGVEFNGHEIVIQRPDGQRRTALAHANPIRDEAGQLLGAVNVLVDVSDRKRAEEALQLADRQKNEFLATLAHELRNPMAPIQGAVQILQRKGAPFPELGWALGVLDRQMRHLTRLVDDLLDVARVVGNRLELRRERLDLAEVVREAVETSGPLIQAAGHELIVELPAGPVGVDGDLTRLAQVVSNLLNNAAKFTKRGGRIWLSARRSGNEAVLTVKDTGVGIPESMLPRIFEMFTQAAPAPGHPSQGGLGIGLTLARRLVELHGGSIAAVSEGDGRGSEFTVRLPATGAAEPAPAVGRAAPGGVEGAAPAPRRVVVVDDNRDSAATVGLLLQMMGHEVRTGADGAEALALVDEFRPEVVLLDLGLPGMSGYDVARAIRGRAHGRGVTLIALTGWGQEDHRARSREAGFDHHLVKPVDLARLTKLLGVGRA